MGKIQMSIPYFKLDKDQLATFLCHAVDYNEEEMMEFLIQIDTYMQSDKFTRMADFYFSKMNKARTNEQMKWAENDKE